MITAEQSVPSYSVAGRAARDVFWDIFNDVNFYVEDADQENLYFEILRRLFPKIKITQIFPLGGKRAMIDHALSPVNAARVAKSVYILDKDFDDLLGCKVNKENLFYLSRYCIENFLLDENAAVQTALECEPKRKREEIRRALDFDNFLQQTLTALTPLFSWFFVVQQCSLGIRNCDCKPEAFSAPRRVWQIDDAKIANYGAEVTTKLVESRIFDEARLQKYLKTAFQQVKGHHSSNISGKFLLALSYHYLRSKVALGNVSLDSLTYRLACNGSLADLQPLQRQIRRYLKKSLAV